MGACASSSAGIEGEREGERSKRSVDRFDPEQPRATWGAVKGPQCWGQRGGAVVDCRHHPHQEPSLRLQPDTPKPNRVYSVLEVGKWCDEEAAAREMFRDTKDLDENRWLLGPDGSRNPGTNGSSDPGRRINFINDNPAHSYARLRACGPGTLVARCEFL